VEDQAASGYGSPQGFGVAQIALNGLDVFELAEFRGIAGQGADGVAAVEELAGDVPA